MKKSLLGYNIKMADDLINSLQNQNDTLTSKVANLTIKLASLESSNNESKTLELETQLKQAQKKNEELSLKIDEQIKNNNILEAEISKLKNENKSSNVDDEDSVQSKIGFLYSKAYKDAQDLNEAVSNELIEKIDNYSEIVNHHNGKMKVAVDETQVKYKEMIATLVSNLDSIFDSLSLIDSENKEIEKLIIKPASLVKDLKEEVCKASKENLKVLTNDMPVVKEEQQQHKESEINSVEELKEKHFKNTFSGQVISVYTNSLNNDNRRGEIKIEGV